MAEYDEFGNPIPGEDPNDPRSRIRSAYATYLGRDPSEDEINSQLGGRKPNVEYAIKNIQGSEEATLYGQRKSAEKTRPQDERIVEDYRQQQWQQPVAGGAWGRYGTANIEGAGGLATGGAQLNGFNTGGWGTDERGTNSIKNTFGKIASRYDAKPSSLNSILNDPDFKRFFPEARIVESSAGDLIDFGDGKPVDVLQAADKRNDSSLGWQWGVKGGAAVPGGTMGQMIPPGTPGWGTQPITTPGISEIAYRKMSGGKITPAEQAQLDAEYAKQAGGAQTGGPGTNGPSLPGGGLRPQVQDQWGRSPSDPLYGHPPPQTYGGPTYGDLV